MSRVSHVQSLVVCCIVSVTIPLERHLRCARSFMLAYTSSTVYWDTKA